MAFDRAFEHGERFRYGALNAGGMGLPEYGPYALVLTRTFQLSLADAACLPGDSLRLCLDAKLALDVMAVKRLTAPHSHRHFLAARERANEVLRNAKDRWPSLLVAAMQYFEVVFLSEFSTRATAVVRVLKTEYDQMWELAFADFGRKLDDAGRATVQGFGRLMKRVRDGKRQLEVIS